MASARLVLLLAGALALAGCQRKPEVEGGAQPAVPAAGEAANLPAAPEALPAGDLPPDQTTPEERAANEAAAAAAGLPPTPFTRTAFACADGTDIEVRFFPEQGIAVLIRDGVNTELQLQPAASGFAYAAEGLAIRGTASGLELAAGSDPPVRCSVRAR